MIIIALLVLKNSGKNSVFSLVSMNPKSGSSNAPTTALSPPVVPVSILPIKVVEAGTSNS